MQCTKRGLLLVSSCYLELLIGLTDVKLHEIASTQQSINCLTNEQQWISVYLHDLVKTPEIHIKLQSAILLRHEEDQSPGWGL